MTNIRSINVRATLKALELAGICPEKFGYEPKASYWNRKCQVLGICRETGVSVVTFVFIK